MEQGSNARMVGATKVNEASSRSHAVFIVIVEKSTSGFSETRSSPGGEWSSDEHGLQHAKDPTPHLHSSADAWLHCSTHPGCDVHAGG